MSMIERVARAIYEADHRSGGWSEWDYVDEAHPGNKALKDRYRKQARAAIKAMRGPTVAMHMAAVAGYTVRDGRCRPAALRDAYDAWIDTALNEQVTG